jgi:hypothetical protein
VQWTRLSPTTFARIDEVWRRGGWWRYLLTWDMRNEGLSAERIEEEGEQEDD